MNLTRNQLIEWRQALASGKYQHGTGAFYRNGRHCAVGVLAALHGITLYDQATDLNANNHVWTWAEGVFGEGSALRDTWVKNDNDSFGTYGDVIEMLDVGWGLNADSQPAESHLQT